MKHQLLTMVIVLMSMLTAQAQVTGDWKGKLEVQGNALDMTFHITKDGENYKSTLDIPAQGASGLPMTETKFENNILTISFAQAGFSLLAS